jgi:transglycosylase-like protein with SLT domain
MPAQIGWRRREEDSLIVTWELPNGAEEVPMLRAEQWKSIQIVEERWGPLCRDIGAKYLLPDGWLQAMIWRESGGNQWARNREGTDDPRDDGLGLLQITSRALKGNWTDPQLLEPRRNLEIGAKYISWLSSLSSIKGDFPKVAAAFNAGSVRDSSANPYGMHSTGNHIDQEVRALNTWTYLKLEGEKFTVAQALAKQFDLQDTLESGHVTLRDDDTSPDTPRNT